MPDIPGLDRLPPPHRPLLGRAAAVFRADERVRAMWVGGSIARGDADPASDLDVLVALHRTAVDSLAAEGLPHLADA